eukprot:9500856-Pyramimonas_sp.AAC.3
MDDDDDDDEYYHANRICRPSRPNPSEPLQPPPIQNQEAPGFHFRKPRLAIMYSGNGRRKRQPNRILLAPPARPVLRHMRLRSAALQ